MTNSMQTEDNTLPGSQQTQFSQLFPTGKNEALRRGKRPTVAEMVPTKKLWQLHQKFGSCDKVAEATRLTIPAVASRLYKAGYRQIVRRTKTGACVNCGNEFKRGNSHRTRCDDCRREAERASSRRAHRKRHPLKAKECLNPDCPRPGRLFVPEDGRYDTCSDECQITARLLRGRKYGDSYRRERRAKLAEAERLTTLFGSGKVFAIPPGWDELRADQQLIGFMLLEDREITNTQIETRLRKSRFRNPWGGNWEEGSLTEPGTGANWISDIRTRVGVPAPRKRK
jgi:hypothetical protein